MLRISYLDGHKKLGILDNWMVVMKEYLKDTINFYDTHVEEYMKQTEKLSDASRFDEFIMRLPKHSKVLDAGCGFGRDSKLFYDKGVDTTGIDLSSKLIEHAKKYAKGVNFLVQDILKLDFEENTFDGVWCCATLVHLSKSDVEVALRLLVRVLKKGGIIYLNFKWGDGEGVFLDPRYNGAPKFYSFFKEEELKSLLKKCKLNMFHASVKNSKGLSGRKTIYFMAKKA